MPLDKYLARYLHLLFRNHFLVLDDHIGFGNPFLASETLLARIIAFAEPVWKYLARLLLALINNSSFAHLNVKLKLR